MATVNGVISAVNANKKTSAAGKPYTVYTITVDGNEYEVGFKKPTADRGDTVNFDWELKYGRKTVVDGSLSKGAASAGSTGVTSSSSRGGFAPKPFPVPADHGDRSILRQNAVTNAREVVKQYGDTGEGITIEEYTARIIGVAMLIEAYTSGDYNGGGPQPGEEVL